MLSKTVIINSLKGVSDRNLNKSIVETGGVREIKLSKGNVSLRIALSKAEGHETQKIQQQIVKLLKDKGANSVGFKFEQLSREEILKLGGSPDSSDIAPSLLNPNCTATFIAITSGKGGVGKTTIAVNLAIELTRLGNKVGLIDADIYGFSIPNMMGITTIPKISNGLIQPIEQFGVKVISIGFFIEDNGAILWRGPMLGKMLEQFFTKVEWGEIDYLLIDSPPGTGDVAMYLDKTIPSIKEILVTTPQETSAFVAERAGEMAVKTGHEIIGVIENMAYYQESDGEKKYLFGQGGGKRLADKFNVELLGMIPISQHTTKCEDGSIHTKNFQEVTQKIMRKTERCK
ncbi:chromosome partitioning protein ParA [Bacillus sp. SA1-12]|nr:chromosome partitioning protein ParA [Bacillus sp. SA1-12]